MNKGAIAIIVIALVVIAVAGYYVVKPSANTNTPANNPQTNTGSSSSSGSGILPGDEVGSATRPWEVNIQSFVFSPNSIVIHVGDYVKWTNMDSAAHTVTSDSGSSELGSNSLGNGQTYIHAFNTAGTYTYHCAVHPGMHATIVVQ